MEERKRWKQARTKAAYFALKPSVSPMEASRAYRAAGQSVSLRATIAKSEPEKAKQTADAHRAIALMLLFGWSSQLLQYKSTRWLHIIR